jgi:rsbT antagonist protein RsbS
MIACAGATVIGHSAEVAFSMVQLGLTLQDVSTALDLEEGLEFLGNLTKVGKSQ